LRSLKLLHLRRKLLLPLPVVGIPFRLDLLLCLEALDLLRIRRSRTHRQSALGSGFLLAAYKAGYVRKPYQADDHDQRNNGRRTFLHRADSFTLRGNGCGWVGVLVGHG
jgi:hypothetical protein